MMKLILLVTVCVLGTALCETHDQQKKFANRLIEDIESATEDTKEMIKNYDVNTEEGKNLILLHANSYNFDLHMVLDSLQYAVIKNKRQPMTLQEIVLKLNDIVFDLEKSFKNGASMVKMQFQRSVENVMMEAKNLRKLVQDNNDNTYRTIVLRYLDDLVTASQKAVARDVFRMQPKAVVKSHIRIIRKLLTYTLNTMNSDNKNVYNDLVRYSSKFSSAIADTRTVLRDLTFTYKTKREDEVKGIVYALSKMVVENDEVLHNEDSLQKVKDQFRLTITNLAEELNKMVDAGYSNETTMDDENLIYIVLVDILNQANQLQRNFERTIDNYIRSGSNE